MTKIMSLSFIAILLWSGQIIHGSEMTRQEKLELQKERMQLGTNMMNDMMSDWKSTKKRKRVECEIENCVYVDNNNSKIGAGQLNNSCHFTTDSNQSIYFKPDTKCCSIVRNVLETSGEINIKFDNDTKCNSVVLNYPYFPWYDIKRVHINFEQNSKCNSVSIYSFYSNIELSGMNAGSCNSAGVYSPLHKLIKPLAAIVFLYASYKAMVWAKQGFVSFLDFI